MKMVIMKTEAIYLLIEGRKNSLKYFKITCIRSLIIGNTNNIIDKGSVINDQRSFFKQG